ncbi:tol-pal system protein YbgF [Litoreibacter roseus]|uniref:Cell division coordinator CpoB n=1 Tax=Litoreibacter roseus TaxID=2601869 RepID=A0A6N6JJD8_9RHOB|nr:tol-pal system protein YbgF [Litoreibacter roseus]GFE65388.1 tol-pal system protein YbgF [Litoreibacter roseus]
MRGLFVLLAVSVLGGTAFAQDNTQTLADIRQELVILNTEIAKLRREMSTTGSPNVNISGDMLQRLDAIEAQMADLTAMTEGLKNRVDRVVADGTNRIGDLEFRLVELEGGDLGSIGETPVLGGEAGAPLPPIAAPDSPTDGVELAVAEREDFERAEAALEAGDYRGAADQFASFTQNYPGGPLSPDAHFFRGQAHENLGDWNAAARAYLESFSGAPNAPRAPEALFKLGVSLNELGQTEEACLMLQEIGSRYPSSDQIAPAQTAQQNMGCS